MTKLFKCPKCGVHIHTLQGYYENCTIYYDFNIDEDGDIHQTNESSDTASQRQYSCGSCGYHSENKNDFIAEIECDCEHEEVTTKLFDTFRIDVCQHCGLVTQVMYIGDEY